jgi:hypothetical protein
LISSRNIMGLLQLLIGRWLGLVTAIYYLDLVRC